MDEQQRQDGDLILTPNTYAYVLDGSKGNVSVAVGPHKISLSNTERMVVWNGSQFIMCGQQQAIKPFATAGEGDYVILENPTVTHPEDVQTADPRIGASTDSAELEAGRRINIPGPVSFALWPGQQASVLPGHHLRYNQYLLVRVYDAEQANLNAHSTVIAPAAGGDGGGTASGTDPEVVSNNFTMGQLRIIQGTDVSFYIPPTGIEVVPGNESGLYVREAVTLETLEYCVLIDENGSKRYVQGPAVVFPQPTERFVTAEGSTDLVRDTGATGAGPGQRSALRKFKAIELNEFSGLYVKVIEEYEEHGETHPVGQELFIRGKDQPIYFPRPEHSIITYGDKRVHYATALPAGEGRYALDRTQGSVELVKGPRMWLPDPRTHVMVQRILSPKVTELLYPGNEEAQLVNAEYEEIAAELPPGSHLNQAMLSGGTGMRSGRSVRGMAGAGTGGMRSALSVETSNLYAQGQSEWQPEKASTTVAADEISRGTYQQPRSLTLDTKYVGAVSVNIFPGYAMMIVDKQGNRRVEIGPKSVLLEYDETPMPLTLSSGKPKNTDHLITTAYLKIINNLVADIVTVETQDLVSVELKVSYRVNFVLTQDEQGHEDPNSAQRWFDIDNYVKVMTDHGRSRLRNVAKKHDLLDFYENVIDIVRDTILGEKGEEGEREGLWFPENNLLVFDVEVLTSRMKDEVLGTLLVEAQKTAIRESIKLQQARASEERAVEAAKLTKLAFERDEDLAEAKSTKDLAVAESLGKVQIANRKAQQDLLGEDAKILGFEREAEELHAQMMLGINKASEELRLEIQTREVDLAVKRAEALGEDVVQALITFGDQQFSGQLVEALGPVAAGLGVTTGDLLKNIFQGTPMENILGEITRRPLTPQPVLD